jgi:subtilisin family serine protease
MSTRGVRPWSGLPILLLLLASYCPVFGQGNRQFQRVLIETPKPYTTVIAAIQGKGGRVIQQFKNVNGLAAEIPVDALPAIQALVGNGSISKDTVVLSPKGFVPSGVKSTLPQQSGPVLRAGFRSAKAVSPSVKSVAQTYPASYAVNNAGTFVNVLHANGIVGAGVIVAVIDSGIRPGFPLLEIDSSVIGGIDFGEDGLGFSNSNNDPHGTFVAGLISGNAMFDLKDSPLKDTIAAYAPNALIGTLLPIIGTAPSSSIYAVRVFDTKTAGAPKDRIIAAIEHVIDLRQKYNAGLPGGLKIEVCNLSLGNTTVAAGRDLLDQSVDALLANGIVPVVASGDAGPATLTIASPASSFSALSVGAAAFAANERIFWEVFFGFQFPGFGGFYRPFEGTGTAVFSARGPNADGRSDPDVMASGFNISQGFFSATDLSFGAGTSFSAPVVAGIAADLRQAFPAATARQIRNAIIAKSDPTAFADGSTSLDRGAGLVNAKAAYDVLAANQVSDVVTLSSPFRSSVKVNVEQGTPLKVQTGHIHEQFTNLKPGQRTDFLFNVEPNTTQIVIDLSNIHPTLPPAQQNQLFGFDDVYVAIHSAKTSQIHGFGDYVQTAFTEFDTSAHFVVNRPEEGVLRISVNGDTTNAGTISGEVTVYATKDPLPQFTVQDKVATGDFPCFSITIPPNTSSADFLLGWRDNWANYPTNDLDLYIVDPNLKLNLDAAQLNSPEHAVIQKPIAGAWQACVFGFFVPTGIEKYELRVSLDGKVVKLN